MKTPRQREVISHQDAGDFLCRFDFDPGEDQWFDARQGVGSPGYPPSVEITEVFIGKWVSPDAVVGFDVEAAEQAAMDQVQAEVEAYWDGYAESVREA